MLLLFLLSYYPYRGVSLGGYNVVHTSLGLVSGNGLPD